MNAITLHAIGLARCGDWRLLDALELVTRARTESNLGGMHHVPGCQALLGYTTEDGPEISDDPKVQCPECRGHGEIEAFGAHRSTWVSCPWCDSEGVVDLDDLRRLRHEHQRASEMLSWRTINGEPATLDPYPSQQHWLCLSDALTIVEQYSKLARALAPDTPAPQLREGAAAPIPEPV